MLSLSDDIYQHLHTGTLLVPSPARAAAVRLAYNARRVAEGLHVWASPDVLTFAAWVDRSLSEARARGAAVPRRLSGVEAWALWTEACAHSASGMLMPEALGDRVRAAAALIDEHDLRLGAPADPESALLGAALQYFEARCAERRALSGRWRAALPWLHPERPMAFAGLPGDARTRWLHSVGAREMAGGGLEANVRVCGFDSARTQAAAAAAWCAAHWRANRGARLLLVVPGLSRVRHLWQCALSDQFDAPEALSVGRYAFESGEPLSNVPLVAQALDWLRFADGLLEAEQISALLRSGYQGRPRAAAGLEVDDWLRERNIDLAVPGALAWTAALDGAPATLSALAATFDAFTAPGARSAQQWAEAIAVLLGACGWPGPELGASEQAARIQFDALLGELASLAAHTTPMPLSRVCTWLCHLAATRPFEQRDADAVVTVSESIDAPLVGYDGIWVADLADDVWPPPPRPDPLIPWSLQARIARASAQGQLGRARSALAGWTHATGDCVLSWAREEGIERSASRLLAPWPVAEAPAGPAGAAARLRAAAPILQARASGAAPWTAPASWRGGVGLLEQQSACPFHAFASFRLRLGALEQFEPGLNALERGRLLHETLAELVKRAGPEVASAQRLALAPASVERVLTAFERATVRTVPAVLWRGERQRLLHLLEALIAWDAERTDARLVDVEQTVALDLAGHTLRLRVDRIDRLADGALAVIDYKSGVPVPFDAEAPRPSQPQLLAYAEVLGAEVAAVCLVHVRTGEAVRLRGIADQPERVPGLRAVAADWPQLRARWHAQLEALAAEFRDGRVLPEPQPGACESCEHVLLCRIRQPSRRRAP